MSKQIQRNEVIHITPQIIGKYENGNPVAIDKISNKRFNPKEVNDKVIIYESEVKEWFLNPALDLIKKNDFNNAFIVLMICLSYFEGVEQYKTGRRSGGRSKRSFKDSVNTVYPNKFTDAELEELYSKSRCGLFHNGMVKGGFTFSYEYPQPIEFQDNGRVIKVNPKLLLEDIIQDFEKYISLLKSTNNPESIMARQNFDRLFTIL